MVGVGQTAISALESGERAPGLTLALDIQRITGIKVAFWPKRGAAA